MKNRKKNRRLAIEIEKNFTCPYERCYKVYGSDVSLNLHIKLKHNGGNKTDREKLAVFCNLYRNKFAGRNKEENPSQIWDSTYLRATYKYLSLHPVIQKDLCRQARWLQQVKKPKLILILIL